MQVRNTNQRKIILQIMKDNFTHPTADEIFEQARSIDSHISRGTVYRNLDFLSETGEILKISVPNGSNHYDSTLQEHYHFCCNKCKKLYDIPAGLALETDSVSEQMSKEGFEVKAHNFIFLGLCPSCNTGRN